jgi:LPPG:FO 2-phospho-L-lactate transferase
MSMPALTPRVLALCGGVGGAKLALGLSKAVPPAELAIVVNTGDDFEHLGLAISPDIDTVVYTLAGLANAELGWGLAGETWSFMAALERLGGETWFRLGDHDLATHMERSRRLAAGEGLAAVTELLARRLGVAPGIWPMSDDPVRTIVDTDDGVLDFQQYFVGRRAEPAVRAITYSRADVARPFEPVLAALASPQLDLVVICPSNPWLSIAPALAMPALRDALRATRARVVAVAPIIAGQAIKGPTAKLMAELGLDVSAATVADWYGDLIDTYILDDADAALAPEIAATGLSVVIAPTLMRTLDDKIGLARRILAIGTDLGRVS